MSFRERVALITGITGQDGSYLTEYLLSLGYMVHGVIRRSSSFNTGRIEHLYNHPHLKLHYGDLIDTSSLVSVISETKPQEIYNLGAQSHVKVSFELAEYSSEVDGIGVLRLLEAVRISGLGSTTRIYQASTSELYGGIEHHTLNEDTPFHPRSPYAIAKLFAYWTIVNHREAYNLYAVNGILFNHESPKRGPTFVTRKITMAVARIYKGSQDKLYLGNLNAVRDWGHAKDYVKAMWLMLQQPKAKDYVIASGEAHSVREFVVAAFACIGIAIHWEGEGLEEIGVDQNGRVLVAVDSKYFRPSEVEHLLGDSSRARIELDWSPSISFQELVREMVEEDLG